MTPLLYAVALCHAIVQRLGAALDAPPARHRLVALQACSAARERPAVGIAAPTVAVLRRMARERGLKAAGGRAIAQARKADLIETLGVGI
jgi:hypothetical protein